MDQPASMGHGILRSNPLNSPLGDSLLHNTMIPFNAMNLNPYTFAGDIGCMIANPGRNMLSLMTNLNENARGRELVMTNGPMFAYQAGRNKMPTITPSLLGKS